MSSVPLAPLTRSRAQIAATLVAAILCGGLGFLPLFAGPGYEAGLMAGVVLPVVAAVATALEVGLGSPSPFDAIGRGALAGLWLALVALAITLLHGAVAGYCDPAGGLSLMALGGLFGAVMGGVWGGAVGLVAGGARTRRRRIVAGVMLALAGPLGGVLISLWRFYTSPMVFAYDPFFGYVAGPVYETVIDPIDELLSYRVGSIATLIAAGVLAWHAERRAGGFALVWRGRPGVVVAGAIALGVSIAVTAAGSELGHWSTSDSIRAELSRSHASERCEIVHSPTILDREAELVGRDCDAHVRALERWFDAAYPHRIVAFVFESEAQKGRLMGAASTYIAKPWRREIYIQMGRYPHPVLGHELAHVVAGEFGEGPFAVAGALGGLLPDPGRIEGVATAAAPRENDSLTLAEQAKSMLELGTLPPVEELFRLDFLASNANKAYSVTGAFMDFLRVRHGAKVVRDWYGGHELETLTGKSLAELDRDFRDSLKDVMVPKEALAAARARFERPGLFERSCPFVVDGLVQEGHAKLAANDWRGAAESFEQALELDPHHLWAWIGFGSSAARGGDYDTARARWSKLEVDPALPELLRMMGTESKADLDLALGRVEPARSAYQSIAQSVLSEDHLRTLDVKRDVTDPLAREAIVALLIGDPKLGTDPTLAAAKLARWSAERPDDGTPDYLLGKNLYLAGRYEQAAERLKSALSKRIERPRVLREAWRTRLIVACALGDRAQAAEARAAFLALPGTRNSQREGIERFAERCGLAPEGALKSPAK